MRYLVTGCAGFIGSTLTDALLADGHTVVGIDCFTSYYDTAMKRGNIAHAQTQPNFHLLDLDLASDDIPHDALEVDGVFHLAAQAGVRASWGSEFSTYTDCNILATQRLLEGLVQLHEEASPRVVYASSSSIYGNALARPTSEDATPAPVSPYGVTKLAAEHLLHTYHQNYGVRSTSLRYFTVFGERQRPDMAFHRFVRAAVTGQPITIYGDGSQSRDFTYVADIVAGTRAAMDTTVPFAVFNLGGGSTITIREVLDLLSEMVDGDLNVTYEDTQRGDVRHTSADTTRAREVLGFDPKVDVPTGLGRELSWMHELIARESPLKS